MKRIQFVFLILLAVIFSASVGAAPLRELYFDEGDFASYSGVAMPEISAQSAFVLCPDTAIVLYEKNGNQQVYPASTVKLMTALVAWDAIPDKQVAVTVSQSAVRAARGSHMSLKAGETLTAEQLFYGLLVTGANDAAYVLAEFTYGTTEAFVEEMNRRAAELGAAATHYTNPSGMHDEQMVTTARDTAVIAAAFYRSEMFPLSDTGRYTVPKTDLTPTIRTLLNRNLLCSRARSDEYYYQPAHGMSFGGTDEAGECLVTSAIASDGTEYLCVVMDDMPGEKDYSNACVDAKALLSACLDSFATASLLSDKSIVCEVPVKLSVNTDYVTLMPESEVTTLLPSTLDYAADISIEPRIRNDYLLAPIIEGAVCGEAVIRYKDLSIATVKLVAAKSVDKSNLLYFLDRLKNIMLSEWMRVFLISALILFAVYFILSVGFHSRKRGPRFGYKGK